MQGNLLHLETQMQPCRGIATEQISGIPVPSMHALKDACLPLSSKPQGFFIKQCPVQGNLLHLQETVKSTDQFPLPALGPKLQAFRDEVVAGRGFQLLRCPPPPPPPTPPPHPFSLLGCSPLQISED